MKVVDVDIVELSQLFTSARTPKAWLERDVPDGLLERLYELTKLAPTSNNCQPLRVLYLRSQESKARLVPALLPGNVDKTLSAPVTAVLAHDHAFYENLPRLFPVRDISGMFRDDPARAQTTAFRNGSIQVGYFILAARVLGLDCGPMSGFDNDAVNREFFAGSSIRSNVICNLGHGDFSGLPARAPRLDFAEACQIL